MPVGSRFVSTRNMKYGFLAQSGRDDLQSYRQTRIIEAAWYAHARQAGEIAWHGEDIRKVHLKRVGGALSQFESCGRAGGSDYCLTFSNANSKSRRINVRACMALR